MSDLLDKANAAFLAANSKYPRCRSRWQNESWCSEFERQMRSDHKYRNQKIWDKMRRKRREAKWIRKGSK